jgi:hypothetical protein
VRRPRRAPAALALALALAAASPPARGHVVYGTPTLRLLTANSDLVARVRILDPEAELLLEDSLVRETVVVAEVLECLKGDHPGAQLRFVQHGHGVPRYRRGEEVAVFARRIERSLELRASPIAERVHWVSEQEAGAAFALDAATRADFVAAVRAYAELEKLPEPERREALRRITVELLASPQPALASSAVRDLVLAAEVPLLGAEDLPVLEPLLASPRVAIGVRMALLAELERRGLLDAPRRWAGLLRTTSGSDRLAVVRAAGAHPSEPVAEELVALLGAEDPALVAAAALSLGAPGNDAAVAPLAKLFASPESRVRMAAIRGLGRVGTPAARKALAEAAASHPDAATRRRAGAEATLLSGREASPRDEGPADPTGRPDTRSGSTSDVPRR